MDVKAFLMQIPTLCRAKNASRWARLIELQYDDELANKNSVFARNADDVENPYNRLETIFGFNGDAGRIAHCKALVAILGMSHYKNSHGETKWDAPLEEAIFVAKATEAEYPDIASVLSVEEASTAETWNV